MTRMTNALVPIYTKTDSEFQPEQVENLDKVITMVGQINTPFLRECTWKRMDAKTPYPQWLEDTYLDPIKTARPWGDQMTPAAYARGKRRQSITQTVWACHSFSEEEKAVTSRGGVAGYNSVAARIRMKQGIAIMTGMEQTILNDNQGTQLPLDSNGYTGKTPTLEAIIKRNVKKASSATVGGWDESSEKFVARTRAADDAARVAISFEDLIDLKNDIIETYSTPGSATQVWMNLAFKTKIASFSQSGVTQLRSMAGMGDAVTVTRNVDMIKTDTGHTLSLKWSPQMKNANNNLIYANPNRVEICSLFRNKPVTLGRKGLSEEIGLATNWGLKVSQEAGMGALFDRKVA